MKKNLWLTLFIVIIGLLFLKLILNLPYYLLISLFLTLIFLYFVSKQKKIIFLYIGFILILINILLLIFAIIPTYSNDVNLEGFYNQQTNYIEIVINDEYNKLDNTKAGLVINNEKKIFLKDWIDKDFHKTVNEGDKIYFTSMIKEIDTVINIYLWDGTVIRLMPQSGIVLSKIKKNKENLLDSQSKIQHEKGSIWFSVIKTINNKESFNINTSHGTLVIRGTSGLLTLTDNTSIIYSHDHLIEIENKSGESGFISKGEIKKFNEENLLPLAIDDFARSMKYYLGKDIDIFQKIKSLEYLDEQNIKEYREKLYKYIIDNFSWDIDQKKFLESLSESKLLILSFINKKYKNDLDNYLKYKSLIENNETISGLKKGYNDLIIVPFNKNIKKYKYEYLKDRANESVENFKTFSISVYNSILDKGENIDIKELTELINLNNYQSKIDELLNKIRY